MSFVCVCVCSVKYVNKTVFSSHCFVRLDSIETSRSVMKSVDLKRKKVTHTHTHMYKFMAHTNDTNTYSIHTCIIYIYILCESLSIDRRTNFINKNHEQCRTYH